MSDADRQAFERLVAVDPAWTAMRRAGDVTGLLGRTLLHCGPPPRPGEHLVKPTLNSAAVACVFEGWAPDLDSAGELVRSGEVEFRPAQDLRVATPMAAVVSPSMWLIEMSDLAGVPGRAPEPAYAPINGGGTGGDPAPRYGRCTEAALEYLRFLNGPVGDALAAIVRGGDALVWLPLVDAALTEGDDAHLRHSAAHARLMDALRARAGDGFAGSPSDEFMAKWPFFHLNFAMAAIRCALGAAEGVPGSALITAFGGNGADFGLQLSAMPRRWFSVAATPPRGKVREPYGPDSGVGAYGDSAIVEAFGLGAMAQRYAPGMQALHADFNPPDLLDLPARLLLGPHPRLPLSGARVGLSARAVIDVAMTPVVELGIVEREGEGGGLGAGLYRPPQSLFDGALAALLGQT